MATARTSRSLRPHPPEPIRNGRRHHQLEQVVEQQRHDDEACHVGREQDRGERHADRRALLRAREQERDPVLVRQVQRPTEEPRTEIGDEQKRGDKSCKDEPAQRRRASPAGWTGSCEAWRTPRRPVTGSW